MENNNALSKQFTTASLIKFALPNIIMMVFFSFYTIVDGMFVSRLAGTLALSGINMSYPLFSVQLAIGIMFGTGGSAVIAKKLGEGNENGARQDFTCIVIVSIITGILFAAVCLPFLEDILILLGTSEAQMPQCIEYSKYLLYFSPAMFLQTIFQVFFVTAGKPTLGLLVTVAGGIANMVLDYLLMAPLAFGVKGAAIATGVSYLIPAAAGMIYFSFYRKGSLFFVKFKADGPMLFKTCSNGFSEMVTNVANAVTTFLFNVIFMRFWMEDGVAAITMIMYFQFVFSAAFLGFSMGVAPVISYKHGAGDHLQLRHIVRSCIGFIGVVSIAIFFISKMVIGVSLAVFTDPAGNVFKIAVEGFPLFAISFIFLGINIFASSLFTAFSNGVISAIISLARTFIFLVGALLILPDAMGEVGIWLAVPVAEFLGLAVSSFFIYHGRVNYGY